MRLPHLPASLAGHGEAAACAPASHPRSIAKAVIAALLLIATALGFAAHDRLAASASDVRLIMVEEKGCRFCRQWDAEIAPAYAKSAEGRFAPLKRVRRGAPDIRGFNPVVYTPTFIVVRRGEEIGRITGYPGPEYFWSELTPILAAAGFAPSLY